MLRWGRVFWEQGTGMWVGEHPEHPSHHNMDRCTQEEGVGVGGTDSRIVTSNRHICLDVKGQILQLFPQVPNSHL